jgi:predicted transcriptional regulator of viral defense system
MESLSTVNAELASLSTGARIYSHSGQGHRTLGSVKPGTKRDVQRVLRAQKQVITRKQARKAGLTRRFIDKRLKVGRWRRCYRGVYVAVTGSVTREAQLRAALLRAGGHAVLSHWTAAEIHKLIDKPFPVIHITVPRARDPARCGKIPGVRIHRSDLILDDGHRARKTLPITSVEDTVIDLINSCVTFDAAYNWMCKALGGGFTSVQRFESAMEQRKRMRYRRDIQRALEAAGGALSWLELRYVRGVEAPHGLPKASRQVRVRQDTGNKYLDNLYEEYKACMELDGAMAHPEDEQWRDKDRDRWNLVHNQVVTARFGVQHLRTSEDLCQTTADVTKILNDRGPAVGYPCTRPGCVVPNYVIRE